MTELNPTSARIEGAGVDRFSKVAGIAIAAGLVLILLNLFALIALIDKERVFAAANEQIIERARQVTLDQSKLDGLLASKSNLESKIADLQSQTGKKQTELDTLASRLADQGALAAKLDAMRAELQGDQEAAHRAVAEKTGAEADRATAKDDLGQLIQQRIRSGRNWSV